MTTDIISNGSKWMGQPPDPIDRLLEVLATHALDPRFEGYGDFVFKDEGDEVTTTFFGNFFELSHVFHIRTTDVDVIARLTAAIRKNKRTKAYRLARAARGIS